MTSHDWFVRWLVNSFDSAVVQPNSSSFTASQWFFGVGVESAVGAMAARSALPEVRPEEKASPSDVKAPILSTARPTLARPETRVGARLKNLELGSSGSPESPFGIFLVVLLVAPESEGGTGGAVSAGTVRAGGAVACGELGGAVAAPSATSSNRASASSVSPTSRRALSSWSGDDGLAPPAGCSSPMVDPKRASRKDRARNRLKSGGYAAARADVQVPSCPRVPPETPLWVVCVHLRRSSESRSGESPFEYANVVYFWNSAPNMHWANVHKQASVERTSCLKFG